MWFRDNRFLTNAVRLLRYDKAERMCSVCGESDRWSGIKVRTGYG